MLLLFSGTDTDTHICASSSDPFLVRSATMAEKRRGPPSRGRPYIWPPRITDAEAAEAAEAGAMAERRRRGVEDWNMITQEEADDLVQKALMRDRAERITDAEAAEAGAMAERRRRVEDMTTAVDTLIKYQKTYNKKYTQDGGSRWLGSESADARPRRNPSALFRDVARSRRRRYVRDAFVAKVFSF